MSSSKLNDRQELFCLEYIKDLNATQAAIRAGYSPKTAQQISSRLLLNIVIQNRIAELQDKRSNELEVDARYVLNRLLEIDQMDVKDILNGDGTVKPVFEWPKVWRTSLSGVDVLELASGDDPSILKKIKWPDKVKNLELLGKHININAFSDRQDIKMSVNPLSELMDEIGNEARNNNRGSEE
ncbi:MAG: terminase small subunit [Wohlfahrtiimonas sp.]